MTNAPLQLETVSPTHTPDPRSPTAAVLVARGPLVTTVPLLSAAVYAVAVVVLASEVRRAK